MKTLALSRLFAGVLATALITPLAGSIAEEAPKPVVEERPMVQLAILLDTSSSMDGLIEQAKTQLWQIVNEFIAAKQDGKAPKVEVALYEYGNSGLDQKQGWIRQVAPLTDDLDKISESLFALKTNGGDEYCGWVIRDAVRDLKWNNSSKVYKAVFIAGNEEFTQGPVKYSDSCKAAIEQGIIVNTIHCGDERAGISGKWQDGAMLADGKFMTIDMNAKVAPIEAPQDKDIATLNVKLNDTYIAYGSRGAESKARQAAQDVNAAAAPGAFFARANCKASANYSNSGWDALDAVKEGKLDLSKAKEEDLPEELRKLPADKRAEYIATKQKERADIQKQLLTLTQERDRYVATQRKEQNGGKRLDEAVTFAVQEQARKKAFVFEGK